MTEPMDPTRRALLTELALGLALTGSVAMSRAEAADASTLPAISEQDPAAKAVQYVEDASRAKGAQSGATCASCSLYSAPDGAKQGACTLFPNKSVKAAGWCTAWSSL